MAFNMNLTRAQFERAQRKGQTKIPSYDAYLRARNRRRALSSWDPVAGGPVPGAVRSLFQREAQRETAAWLKPRQAAINTGTEALARSLGGLEGRIGSIYGQAQQSQTMADAGLRAALARETGATTTGLAQQLAAAGQNPAAISNLGGAASGTLAAHGSANVGQLISHGAAAQAFGAQMPGVARLAGIQQTGMLQRQGADMSRERYREILDRELEKWIARSGLGMDQAALDLQRDQFAYDVASGAGGGGGGAGGGKGKERRARVDKARDGAFKLAEDLYGRTRRETDDFGDVVTVPNPPPWNVALQQVRTFIAGRVGRALTSQQITTMARNVLKSAGFRPGIAGEGAPLPGSKT